MGFGSEKITGLHFSCTSESRVFFWFYLLSPHMPLDQEWLCIFYCWFHLSTNKGSHGNLQYTRDSCLGRYWCLTAFGFSFCHTALVWSVRDDNLRWSDDQLTTFRSSQNVKFFQKRWKVPWYSQYNHVIQGFLEVLQLPVTRTFHDTLYNIYCIQYTYNMWRFFPFAKHMDLLVFISISSQPLFFCWHCSPAAWSFPAMSRGYPDVPPTGSRPVPWLCC